MQQAIVQLPTPEEARAMFDECCGDLDETKELYISLFGDYFQDLRDWANKKPGSFRHIRHMLIGREDVYDGIYKDLMCAMIEHKDELPYMMNICDL